MSRPKTMAVTRRVQLTVRAGMASALVVLGCGGAATPQKPPGEPPSPQSVTVAEPGGDAEDPHRSALERQLTSEWGQRNDKDDQLLVPLPDHEHWKRVRFFGVEHFVAFRYGKQAHAVTVGVVQDVEEGQELDSEHCLRRFDKWARPQIRAYDVKLGPIGRRDGKWRDVPLVIQYVDGHVDWMLSRRRFSAAWTAYPAYPKACLIYAIGVQWGDHEQLAKRVRDRWMAEGFQQMAPLTPERPYRR